MKIIGKDDESGERSVVMEVNKRVESSPTVIDNTKEQVEK